MMRRLEDYLQVIEKYLPRLGVSSLRLGVLAFEERSL
jgi:hypothetical protein